MKKKKTNKSLLKNKKAIYDYEILDCIEVGLVLFGTEVKSIRKKSANLKNSFVKIINNEVFIFNFHISKFGSSYFNHDEKREKKLLLKKIQIKKLLEKVKTEGMTLIVSEIYQPNNSKKIKAKLCLAKGKKNYDKRETLKRKTLEMETKRMMKDF